MKHVGYSRSNVYHTNYNSLENPIGIETGAEVPGDGIGEDYNSLENPIGIETVGVGSRGEDRSDYNSLENPIGIETG